MPLRAPVRLIAFIVTALMVLAPAPAAFGHASLLSSEPAEGSVLAASPERVILIFNEPVSPLRLQLISPGGQSTGLRNVVQHDATVIAPLPAALGQGTHVLSWRVVSADGHPVGGTVLFSVGQADANPAPVVEATDFSVLAAVWLAKLALYAAMFFCVGGVFFAAWISESRPLPGSGEKVLRALLLAGLAVAPLSIGLQGLDGLSLPLSALAEPAVWQAGFGTSYAMTAIAAVFAVAAALLAMAAQDQAVARLRSAAGLAAVGLALAASGHAASAQPQWLMRPAVFLHVTAIAFWIGALLPLAILLRTPGGAARESLRRFSRIIPYVVGPLLISGAALAVVQLASIDALWTTAYGWIFLAKMALVALLFALAAINRFVLTARAEAGDAGAIRQLRGSVAAELAIALVIFGVVASWRFTPPPRALAAAVAAPEFIHFHGEKVMADITLEPGRVGRSRANVLIRTANFEPMAPKGVTLVFSQPESGIEPFRREAVDIGDYAWRVDNVVIPVPGRWRLRVEVLINDFEQASLEDNIEIRD